MNVVDVHNRIKKLADERGIMSKVETLEKICNGMEVSLSDFFVFLSKHNHLCFYRYATDSSA